MTRISQSFLATVVITCAGCAVGEPIEPPLHSDQRGSREDAGTVAPLLGTAGTGANGPAHGSRPAEPMGGDCSGISGSGGAPDSGKPGTGSGGDGATGGSAEPDAGAGETPPPPSSGSGQSGVPRPPGNTGKGFFVKDRTIYDANGVEFRVRGLNHTHWWGQNNEAAIPHVARTGANTVRVVFGSGMGASTPAARRSVVEAYLSRGIVPMVDQHDGTCKTDVSLLEGIVDFWTNPEDRAWLVEHERRVILNIANEWGPTDSVWRDAYINAIARLRAAGINALLVVDAGECGQSAGVLLRHAREVFESDPQKNVAFSVHMYTYWVDAGSPKARTWSPTLPYDMDQTLAALDAQGLAHLVGEFSWQGASDLVWYTTKTAMQLYERYQMGWLAWSWNQNSDPQLDMVKGYTYDSAADLTAFGALAIDDPEVGLKALARPATVF
jgi:mannan endo-1,4-beta-mannosidase